MVHETTSGVQAFSAGKASFRLASTESQVAVERILAEEHRWASDLKH